MLCSYDYSIHAEGLLPAKLCLPRVVILVSSEQCLQCGRFHIKFFNAKLNI